MIITLNLLTFLIIYLLIITLAIWKYDIKKKKYHIWILFPLLFYCLCVIKVCFFPIRIFDQTYLNDYWNEFGEFIKFTQFVPGKTINSFLKLPYGNVQIIGNILLLFPFPFFCIYSI